MLERATGLSAGFNAAVGLSDQMNRSVLRNQQGQAGDLYWWSEGGGGGHVTVWDLRLLRWTSTFMRVDK